MTTRYHYRAETHAIADRHGLDPDVVTALVMQESAGQTHAYAPSSCGWRVCRRAR